MNDLAGLQSRNLVALCTVTLLDVPRIAWITGMEGEKISVVGMEGDYNKLWKVT